MKPYVIVIMISVVVALIWVGKITKEKESQDELKTVLCKTPPLGWNSFQSYNCNIYEEVALNEIDAFIEKFAPHGYEYFVIDNGWFTSPNSIKFENYLVPTEKKCTPDKVSVDEYGIVQPSELFFPNGLKPLIDKLHANGLKFGVHLMRGIPRVAVEKDLPIKDTKYTAKDIVSTFEDCKWCTFMHGVDMTKPGAQEYYNSVMNQFAKWGIDFVKVDHVTHFPADIQGYAKAIEQCGRPMVLSLSAGKTSNIKYLDTYKKANMVRTTPDIWDNQESIERSFSSMRKWQGLEDKGFWPDLDMIPFGELWILNRAEVSGNSSNNANTEFMGNMHHWGTFTEAQKETFITQRAIAASPIIIGGSMISMDEHSYKLLTNKEMLACCKNGIHGKLVYENEDVELWCAPLANNDRFGFQEYVYHEGWFAIFNRTDKKQTVNIVKSFPKFLPNGKYNLKDVWGGQSFEEFTNAMKMNFDIESNGVVFIKYEKIDS
jgi:alpha-galactosidase